MIKSNIKLEVNTVPFPKYSCWKTTVSFLYGKHLLQSDYYSRDRPGGAAVATYSEDSTIKFLEQIEKLHTIEQGKAQEEKYHRGEF